MGPTERAMSLAAVTGLRLALGPAFLATSQRRPWGAACVMAALGEMVIDKLGIAPRRSRLPLLVPRALAGAWVAHESLKHDGQDTAGAAALGAAVAAGTAVIAPMVRIAGSRVLGIPDAVLGVAEDYLALTLASEATGLPMEDLPRVVRESVEGVAGQIRSEAERVGIGAS